MKYDDMDFKCEACKKWSDDDEICSHCGQKLPTEYSQEGYFVAGYDTMSEEERQQVRKRISELYEQERKSK